MDKELLETNQRFSNLYSTLLSVKVDLKYNDLYKSDQFKKWLKKPEFWLYLWSSSPWSWKTTTAIKLSQHLVSMWYRVLALTLIDYKNHLKREFWVKNWTQKSFYDYIYRYDFIMLDDISYWVSWEWVQEILKDLLDMSFNKKTPKLILTSQMEVHNLPMNTALKSRIQWVTHSIHFPETDKRKWIKFNF